VSTADLLATRRQVHVDVRDDLRRGQEPFAKIMAAVKGLREDEVLALRAPFEPVPLYEVLARRGFAHSAERHAADDWCVWFYREDAAAGHAVVVLDVRGMAPPGPMVTVLERLDTLGPDETLLVVHDRRPVFLYPQLEARGFVHATDDSEPGVVRIRIRRIAATGRSAAE
jgi:uncharacterized protein (DUF2249 family)